MKLLKLFRCFVFSATLGALAGNAGAAATITVNPASIPNTYSGPLSVQIAGVPNGATVRVELLRDFNGNNAVDAADVLLKRFTLVDGTIPTLGGRTNSNVPADLDGAANGALTVTLDYRNTAAMDHVAGSYILRLSSPTSAFAAVTTSLTVTAAAFPQSVTGTVAGASNCVVVLVDPAKPANVVVGTTAAANGSYTLPCPVGQFKLLALQAGSVTDVANAPQVNIGATQTVPLDFAFLNPDRTLTGLLLDGPGGAPLPGVQVIGQSSGQKMVLGFTDAAGAFSLAATSDTWNLDFSAADLAKLGCLGLLQAPPIDATVAPVPATNFEMLRATSLIFGRITDEANHPVVGAYVTSLDIGNYLYTTFGTTDANGNYTLGVADGPWFVEQRADRLSQLGYLGRSAVVTAVNATATAQDFTVRSVTATVQGVLVDDSGAPVAGMTIYAMDTVFNIQKQVLSGPGGAFSLGLFGSTWSLASDDFAAQQLGMIAPRVSLVVQDGVNQSGLVYVFLRTTATISGVVTNAAGQPLTSTYVTANLTVGNTNYQTSGFTVQDGTYAFRVSAGAWQFSLNDLSGQGYANPAPQDRTITGDTVINWSVAVAPPTPPTLQVVRVTAGRYQLTLTGQTGRNYTIESATALRNPTWTPVITNAADPNGVLVQEDTPAADGLPRFYRARVAP